MRKRLTSLDALRGFDMFWIVGGTGLVAALAEATNWRLFHWMETQSEHPEWNGFTLYDLIFPLFLFLAGVSMPYSIAQATRLRPATSGRTARPGLRSSTREN